MKLLEATAGGTMAVWHPHLRLKLEPDAVTASTASRTSLYHTPTFDPRLREVSRQLLDQMNIVLSRSASGSERSKAEAAVQQLGLELYEEIFSVSGEDGRLEEVLRDTLLANSSGATPSITVEGEWYALPWELVRVPADICGEMQDKYLGELAIVSGLLGPQRHLNGIGLDIDGRVQIACVAGFDLKHSASEVQHVRGLSGPYLEVPRVLENLSAKEVNRNSMLFRDHMNGPKPADVLHGAFHSEAPRPESAFEIHVHRRARLSSSDLGRARVRIDHPNVAFFNTCQCLSDLPWRGGGLARYAMQRWKSEVVIASVCKIDDLAATRFSKAFLSRILPLHTPRGEAIGPALYATRVSCLASHDPADRLIGLSYRLLGPPFAQLRVQLEEAA